MKEAAIVIVNYNTAGLLRACLNSIRRAGSPDKVIVVDNASTDDSCSTLQAQFPATQVIRKDKNCGYGSAANQGISGCSTRYVLLLNSDTQIQPGTLEELVGYLDLHPQAAIAGPRLVGPDRALQPSCFPFPSPLDLFLDSSHLARLARFIPVLKDKYLRSWDHASPRSVPWVAGAALAIRREAFEAAGGFDESYFMYYEEVDLCYRLSQLGWQIHYAPTAEVIHIGGSSTRQNHTDMAVRFYASLAHFYQRHYSGWRLAQLALLVEGVAAARLARDTVLVSSPIGANQRDQLLDNISAWRRLLLGEWLNQGVL